MKVSRRFQTDDSQSTTCCESEACGGGLLLDEANMSDIRADRLITYIYWVLEQMYFR